MKDSPVVRTRRVHYIAGLDPRGARFYHRLYEEEGRKQSEVTGVRVEIGPLQTKAPHVQAWQVRSKPVETDYQFMDWEDLMRDNWGRLASMKQQLRYLRYVLSGECLHVAGASRYFFYTTLIPFLYLLLWGLVLVLGTTVIGWGVVLITHNQPLALALSALTLCALLYLGWRYAKRKRILWLLRVCTCVLDWAKSPDRRMEDRVAEFTDHILYEQERDPADEVLIVGHSLGAILSIQATARILQRQPDAASKMHLLTLGSSIPFLGVLPSAKWFRQELTTVADDARLAWTDFTAIKDILCFFKMNPTEACGIVPRDRERPRCFPMRIYRMFSKEAYARVLRDHLRVHLQYLMAGDMDTEYDYFRMTAGPHPLQSYKMDKSKRSTND